MARGAYVVGTVRDVAKGRKATTQIDAGGFELAEMDLANLGSVRACAGSLVTKGDRFDAIIANAGVMTCHGPKSEGSLGTDAPQTEIGRCSGTDAAGGYIDRRWSIDLRHYDVDQFAAADRAVLGPDLPEHNDLRVPMVRIRASRQEDGDHVVSIWRASVDATHDFLSKEDRESIDRQVQDFLPKVPLWLAVDNRDHPLGFMGLSGSHMEALFIDPAFRGMGVGRALVKHALTMHSGLTTDVNEQNDQAVGFYRHLGFVPVGRSALDGEGRAYPLLHLKLGRARPAL